MATAHFVKPARKDNEVAKKGESYYWWKFRFGGKHYSKTPPRPSQLTQSEFLSTIYDLQERIEAIGGTDLESAKGERESIVDELRTLADEQEEKRGNMPESLQDSESGQLLQERYDDVNSMADDLEGVDLDLEKENDESDEDFDTRVQEALDEAADVSYCGS